MISTLICKSKSPVTAVTLFAYIIKYSLTPQFRALIVAIKYSASSLMRLINATTSDVKEYILFLFNFMV